MTTDNDRYPEPLEQCLSCGLHDFDLQPCAIEDCDAKLHQRCGTGCEICGAGVCSIHAVVVDEHYDACVTCAAAMKITEAA